MEINARIKDLRLYFRLSRESFAEKLRCSPFVIRNIEYGNTEPKPMLIDQICDIFGVNRNWIETGEGEMFEQLTEDEELAGAFGDLLGDPDSVFKKKFIGALLELDESEWETIEKFCRKVIADRDKEKEDGN